MPSISRLVHQVKSIRVFKNKQLKRGTFAIQLNWNFKFEFALFFLVFGFYGWGSTAGLNNFFNFKNLLPNIALCVTFAYIFYRRNRLSHIIPISFNYSLMFVFSIYLLIGIINSFDLLRKSLTIDEVAYASDSQMHSYVVTLRAANFLPETIRNLNSAFLLQMISLTITLILALALFATFRLKNDKIFGILVLIATFSTRTTIQYLGGASSPNSPLSSIWYFITSSLFGISNLTFRLSTTFIFSLLATYIFFCLKKNEKIPSVVAFFFPLLFFTVPLLAGQSASIEIANWTFLVCTFLLVKLATNGFVITNNILLTLAVSFYLRINLAVPLIASLICVILANKQDLKSVFSRVLHYLIIVLPGLVVVASGRFADRISRGDYANDFQANLENTSRAIKLSGSSVYLAIGICVAVYWILRVRSRLFTINYLVLNLVLFLGLNTTGTTTNSKYLLEFLFPLVISGLFCLVLSWKFFHPTLIISMIIPLLVLNLWGISTKKEVLNNFRSLYHYTNGKIGDTYPALAYFPLPLHQAFDYLRISKVENCFNAGVVYGSFPEILEGLPLSQVAANRDTRSKFLEIQASRNESWTSVTLESLQAAEIKCVILGAVDDQGLTAKILMLNGWKNVAQFKDPIYGTSVTVLTNKI